MSLSLPQVPEAIAGALEALVQDLSARAGQDFAGLVLFGGLARGRYRAGRSDVNVVVLLHRADADVLRKLAPALRTARRAVGVDAMLLATSEVATAALDFPTKFLDIRRHHIVLHGEDLFASLDIPLAAVQRRVAQSLRNMLLRLRRRYLASCDDAEEMQLALADIARPLAIDFAALLLASGQAVPDEDRTAAVYALAGQAYGLDADTLSDLAALRDRGYCDEDAVRLCERLLDLLSNLADRVDAMARAA